MKKLTEQLQEAINDIERWEGIAYQKDDEVGNAVESIKDVVKKLSPYPYDEGDDYWTIEDSQVIWSCWDEQSEDMHDENKKYFNTDIDAVRYAISKGIKITKIDKLNGEI